MGAGEYKGSLSTGSLVWLTAVCPGQAGEAASKTPGVVGGGTPEGGGTFNSYSF